MQTIAIIIGVSRYRELEDLPAAKSDALAFARALRYWGIPEDNLFIFLNEQASCQALRSCFETLKLATEPFKLIFYFCGHGVRTVPPHPKSFLLLDQDPYPLEMLVEEICHLNSYENYLFIDACHLRINAFINPELESEIDQKKEETKSLFCLLSSGIESSYEDIQGEYGYFTRALLQALSHVRTKEKNLTPFLDTLYAQLRTHNLAAPEMYNFETHSLDIFPPLKGRQAFIARIQDLLIKYPDKILCLTGEKGIGKSTIGKQLVSDKCCSFYAKEVPSTIPPHSLIILDREVSGPLPLGSQWIVLSRHSLKHSLGDRVIEIDVPPMDLDETSLLLKDIEDPKAKELIFLAAKGNPEKIQQILQHNTQETTHRSEYEALKGAISAVVACGGYLNEELFALIHEIELNQLFFMEKIGMIVRTATGWVAHDYLVEMAQSENLVLNKDKALSYWCQQLDQTPQETVAAQSLILTLKCLGYESELEPYLEQAVNHLAKEAQVHIPFFEDAAVIYLSHKIFTSTTWQLAAIFLEQGFPEKALELLNLAADDSSISLLKGHCLWRLGYFKEGQKILSQSLPSLEKTSLRLQSRLYRGSISFFLGEWDEALKDFEKVYENGQGSLKYLAQVMSGSVLSLSGRDIAKGRGQLETATRLLTKHHDLKGAWVGWNNLGELLWKVKEYRAAQFHLQRALELAYNNTTRQETLRNLLELYLRTIGPFAPETVEVMGQLQDQSEPFEEIQRLQTLAFAHLLRGEMSEAERALYAVSELTLSNPYMHEQTLVYLGLLQKEKSSSCFGIREEGVDLQTHVLKNVVELFEKYQGEYARSTTTHP